jgi:rSAM/selenodomain-associated transferase 2
MTEERRPSLSIIIPTFNEASCIQRTLDAVARVRGNIEVIVADGGSDDSTTEIARRAGARVIICERGRGSQMHSGASAARGEALLFLHADTILPYEAATLIENCLSDDALTVGGNFEIRFDGASRAARFMTWLYPRLAQLGFYYGDSGIFVRAGAYEEVGGFKSFPIFEDLDLVRRLRRKGRMKHLPIAVTTSSRRFENRRFVFTFLRWSLLQVLYWLGVSPMKLGRFYGPGRDASTKSVAGFQSRSTFSHL